MRVAVSMASSGVFSYSLWKMVSPLQKPLSTFTSDSVMRGPISTSFRRVCVPLEILRKPCVSSTSSPSPSVSDR